MQFLLLAYDAKDKDALNRRMAAREAHLESMARYKAFGNMKMGAALLDDAGNMVGSTVIADFNSRAEFDAWLAQDPYTTGKVWTDVKVTECKIAPSFVGLK